MIKGTKFSQAVTEKKEGVFENSLSLRGSGLAKEKQRAILKDWLSSSASFEEVCRQHGFSPEETERLKSKLPPQLVSLKEAQEKLTIKSSEEIDEKEVKKLLTLDGIRFSRMLRTVAEVMFDQEDFQAKDLSLLVSSWFKVIKGMKDLLEKTEKEGERDREFRALLDLTKEEFKDLRERILEYRKYRLEAEDAEVILSDDAHREDSNN